ncbi:MAG: 16S rRNA (cytosine(967)-C(5))-methyltransferase [Prochlorothrix sp.]
MPAPRRSGFATLPAAARSCPRQAAFLALKAIAGGSFADVAVDNALNRSSLSPRDRRLATEIVYGCVRRQYTLDTLIDQLATKPASHQPSDLRLILQVGLYQLRYLSQVPASAAVDTTVELAKNNGFRGLAGFVNGVLRQYGRQAETAESGDPLVVPETFPEQWAVRHSLPAWIVAVWQEQLLGVEVEALCDWMNQTPNLDLRINPLRCSLDQVIKAFAEQDIKVEDLPIPQGLRVKGAGKIQDLPGFEAGWWMVQDSSAQLVGHFLDPQPGETVIDACAAPGGKTLHLAELMQDQGRILACDQTASRLRKLTANQMRLGMQSIEVHTGDCRQWHPDVQADRVLLDVPCSGLGTLHRHADARWRQSEITVKGLASLQGELLEAATHWLKPGGILLYSTCTLHPQENERQIETFLANHPDWTLVPPEPSSPLAAHALAIGWVKVWPQRANMDGFFMAKLRSPA